MTINASPVPPVASTQIVPYNSLWARLVGWVWHTTKKAAFEAIVQGFYSLFRKFMEALGEKAQHTSSAYMQKLYGPTPTGPKPLYGSGQTNLPTPDPSSVFGNGFEGW